MTDKKFADEFSELEAILEWFESDKFDLDKAETKFNEGIDLAEKLTKRLKAAKLKVQKLD